MDFRRDRPHTGIARVIAGWRGAAAGSPAAVAVLDRGSVPDRSPWPTEPYALRRAARDAGARLVHAVYPYGLVAGTPPTLLTIHDTIQVERRDARGAVFRALVARNLRHSPAVLTISAHARDRIAEVLGVPHERIHVAHNGVEAADRGVLDDRDPYLLYVGNDKPHKHVRELLAWSPDVVGSRGLRLVAVLPPDAAPRYADLVGPHVEIRCGVPDDELDRLLGAATAYVSLSDAEGFGLVPLEAAARGVPSVLADAGAHREVLADGAEYCAVDRDDLSAALDRLLSDRDVLAERALARAPLFSWSRSWQAVTQVHAAVLAELD